MSKVKLSPALVVSLIALFFALGGSAFALTKKPAPQARCAQGAVRGVVEVTGQVGHGVANVPDAFTSNASFFGRSFNCTAGAVLARRLDTGVYEVRFPGNGATSAVASANGTDAAAVAVQRLKDGTFHVTVGDPRQLEDEPFTLVAF